MKAKSSYSQFIATTSARGTMAMVGMVGLFLTIFILWSFLCLSGALINLLRNSF